MDDQYAFGYHYHCYGFGPYLLPLDRFLPVGVAYELTLDSDDATAHHRRGRCRDGRLQKSDHGTHQLFLGLNAHVLEILLVRGID